jgi:hypothetical protein
MDLGWEKDMRDCREYFLAEVCAEDIFWQKFGRRYFLAEVCKFFFKKLASSSFMIFDPTGIILQNICYEILIPTHRSQICLRSRIWINI